MILLVDARSGVGFAEQEILSRLPRQLARIIVFNKVDLAGRDAERHVEPEGVAISLSAKSGDGVELLRREFFASPAGIQPKTFSSPANDTCGRSLKRAGTSRRHARSCPT